MTRTRLRPGAAALAVLALAALCAWTGVPFPTREKRWAIGIYTGASPLSLAPAPGAANPVVSAADVTDVPARFVADPFMVTRDATWFMFFEVLNAATAQGDIGLATSADARQWRYQRIVLDEPFHLSYPHVFEWDGVHYLVPSSEQTGTVRLYRAADFPTGWVFAQTLIAGHPFSDPTLVRRDGTWWLFAASDPATNGTLRLYFADQLAGPWQEHPRSPIVRDDPRRARPAGRMFTIDGSLYRLAQDSASGYGRQVWLFEVIRLDRTDYAERAVGTEPFLQATGHGWNAAGVHHVDPHPLADGHWIAAVDGCHKVLAARVWTWR